MYKTMWFNGLYYIFENLFQDAWNIRNNLLSLPKIK